VEVTGQIGRRIAFELSRDFNDRVAVKDAYVNLRLTRALEVSGGRFKVPFSREMLVGRANLDFIYRSLGSSLLAPSRDTGVMVHGRVFGRRLRYQAGYFAGDGDNASAPQVLGAHGTVALRVVATPLAGKADSARSRVQIGLAVAGSRLDDQLGLRGRTLLEDGEFFDRVYVNGRRLRVGLEALWTTGPASLGGEYMLVSDERSEMGFRADDLPAVRARAWYLMGTWAVTGETKDGASSHAIVSAPSSWLGVGSCASMTSATPEYRSFPKPVRTARQRRPGDNAGINLPNRHVRVQYNHVIESVADAQRSPAPLTQGRFATGVLRLQLRL
jgi:phosphate-selective porin